MRARDIVNQLAVVLPSLVDDFTTQHPVTSLTRAGTTATVTTSGAHGLNVGEQVNVVGAETPILIESIDRLGMVATMVTDSDHDLTENAGFDVQIFGAAESEFNGTFKLLKVPNRRTIKFQVDDSGPISATGTPLLLNGTNVFQSYNGLREVTATPTTSTFEYEVIDATLFTPASGDIVVKSRPRISAGVDIERIIDAYTRQEVKDGWLFVVIGDSSADKNRHIDTDATDNIQNGHYFNQRLTQTVQLFVILPTSEEIAGRSSRDRCEELLKPICNSVLAVKFPSLVENNNNPLMITGHGSQAYSTAFYVHQYSFEATLQLGPSDIFIPSDDVAFRDIDMTTSLSVGTESISTNINLDDEPLI